MNKDSTDPIQTPPQSVASLAALASDAQYALYDAHQALNKYASTNPGAVRERRNLDTASLLLTKAKWLAGKFNGTNQYFAEFTQSPDDADEAATLYLSATEVSHESETILRAGDLSRTNSAAARHADSLTLTRKGTEITFVDDIPLVPTVCPIVMLQGSSYEMGRQYVRQVIEIFGSWVFERLASREFTEQDRQTITTWHGHLERHTPEITEMAQGWVDEASEQGISLSYLSAIQLWTGHFEPIASGIQGHGVRELMSKASDEVAEQADSSYLGGVSTHESAIPAAAIELCSGCCAWGDATVDGKLVTGSTTDHDCTFQVTIVAYPDHGNAFIYTPFSVNGFIPGLGQYYFAGHPGMNDKGLAYVHHGGGLHGIETAEDRGDGLRRGASVFHNLRFANDARAALRNELSWPVGDVGSILGSVGGFYADGKYAYVCEARPSGAVGSTPIVREMSFDETGASYPFLYANNNSMHPRSASGFDAPQQGYQYDPIDGWVEDRPAAIIHHAERHFGPALSTKSSQGRNRYLFESLKSRFGAIDVDKMREIVSTSAPERLHPDGTPMTHRERENAWLNGHPWPSSTSHRINAFTAIMRPSENGDGLYMGCIGPADFRARMHTPGHGNYYYDEANEFWEIQLRTSAEELLACARDRASELLMKAEQQVHSTTSEPTDDSTRIDDLLLRARNSFDRGSTIDTRSTDGLSPINQIAQAVRRFTECQVRAKQAMTEHSRRIPSDK